MNKKSQMLGKIGVSLASFLYFIMLFVIFYIVIQPSSSALPLKSQWSNVDAKIELLDLLRTPVELNGAMMQMSDLIALWQQNKSYEQVLQSEMKKLLNKISYNYINTETENERVKAYSLGIFSKKQIVGESPQWLLYVESQQYKPGYDEETDLASSYLPLIDNSNIYLTLRASNAAREVYG